MTPMVEVRRGEVCLCVNIHLNCNVKQRVNDLLQFFSSEASAQSMTWLHQAELGTQLPSLHDNSDEPHVTSGGENLHFKKITQQKQHSEAVSGTAHNNT